MADLPPELLAILACPQPDCRAALQCIPEFLECTGCGRRYPNRGAWPTLIPEEALPPRVDDGA